jgi:hypothetical protein
MIRSLRFVLRVRWCFSLLNYLLRSPLYDQKSKVWTMDMVRNAQCTCSVRVKCALVVHLFPALPTLYDQNSKVVP